MQLLGDDVLRAGHEQHDVEGEYGDAEGGADWAVPRLVEQVVLIARFAPTVELDCHVDRAGHLPAARIELEGDRAFDVGTDHLTGGVNWIGARGAGHRPTQQGQRQQRRPPDVPDLP